MLLGILWQYMDFGFKRVLALFLTFLLFSVFLCTIQIQSFAQQATKPLLPEDLIKIRTFGYGNPIEISPDGKWVAYTIREDNKLKAPITERYEVYTRTGVVHTQNGCSVLITDTKSGTTINLGTDSSTSWGPSWSPDGKYLAFYSDRSGVARLWVYEITTHRYKEMTNAVVRPFHGYYLPQWTPDSRSILLKILPNGHTNESSLDLFLDISQKDSNYNSVVKSNIKVFTSNISSTEIKKVESVDHRAPVPIKNNIKMFADLGIIDTITGKVRRLTSGEAIIGYWLSPDGKNLIYSTARSFVADNSQQTYSDIVLVSLSDGQNRIIASNMRMYFTCINVSWSPNSKYIGILEYGPLTNGDCFIVSIAEGGAIKIQDSPHPSFGGAFKVPVWDRDGNVYCYSSGTLWKISIEKKMLSKVLDLPNHSIVSLLHNYKTKIVKTLDNKIYLVVKNNVTQQIGAMTINIDNYKYNLLFEEGKTYGNSFSYDVSLQSDIIVYESEDPETPRDLWIANLTLKDRRRLSNINPQLSDIKFGRTQIIQWKTADGQTLRGVLLLPSNYKDGIKYPMIILVYGDSYPSNYLNYFGGNVPTMGNPIWEPHLFSTRGYVVFMPDIQTKIGTPMKSIADSVIPGIDKVISLGIVDQDKVGVLGQSYGGYTTLSLLVQSERFKAAMMTSGYGNIIGYYGMMSIDGGADGIGHAEEGQGKMGNSPWKNHQRYIENSPIFYLDRIKTPLLIVHGTGDTAVPVFLADEIFVGLRRLDKEVMYVKYAHEDHGFMNSTNMLDYFRRSVEWFDKYLNPKVTR